ncbi:MAG: ABC transporter permease, partial [Muribaculaceae bacterium]|nr:ABC transporter permease [Muribaculaceae bacterium]
MKSSTGFKATVRREINRMTSRKMYLFGIFIAPIAIALFFIALLDRGLPLQTPVAVVDLDHSQMSRTVSRSIAAEEVVKLVEYDESFTAAMDRVRSGEIYGFFVIPENFEADALGGRTPTLEFYSNMTYFVPGTFVFKGFKTVTVATSAGVIKTTLVDLGVDLYLIHI